VNAHVIDNLAQDKTATQFDTRLKAGAAVDGNANTPSCTKRGFNMWWAVDLVAQYVIATVKVTTYTYNNDNDFGNRRPPHFIHLFIHSFIHSLNYTGSIINRIIMIVHKFRFREKKESRCAACQIN